MMGIERRSSVAELLSLAEKTRVFLSMPYLEGVTPVCMRDAEVVDSSGEYSRRHGVFRLNEAGLSPFDHGNLYGDAVFEGIRIDGRCLVLLKEHVERLFRSAERLQMEVPYCRVELANILVSLSRASLGESGESGYLRPVLTRGIGNLGLNPLKCIGTTLYAIGSSISLYPEAHYEKGIDVAIARHIRRNSAHNIDPTAKTNNYLNNILAFLETRDREVLETIMLTPEGYLAEATADNIFVAERMEGRVRLRYPASRYALVGLTRNLVIEVARQLGYELFEDDAMLPTDLIGPNREVFITGTACGIMPVKRVDGLETACASQRLATAAIRAGVESAMMDSVHSLSIDAAEDEISAYMAAPLAVPVVVGGG